MALWDPCQWLPALSFSWSGQLPKQQASWVVPRTQAQRPLPRSLGRYQLEEGKEQGPFWRRFLE